MLDLDVERFVKVQVDAVRRALGGEKALIAISGGVDSTVSAIITHKAIGDNLACVFIDDNFMRLGEPEKVRVMLSSPPLKLPVKILDAKERFMGALKGLGDAEEKRMAFRETFYETLSDAARNEGCRFLVQGTIKADVVETQGGVKTQHNVLEQIGINPIERFGFKIIEPIASLYKYQVREVARSLGAPPEVSERQPFPGPGLSVRIVGEITPTKLDELKRATSVVEEEFSSFGPDQYFAAIFSGEATKAQDDLRSDVSKALKIEPGKIESSFLSERATGILDGRRAYGRILALEIDTTSKRTSDITYSSLEEMRSELQEGHPEITRVLILIGRRDRKGYTVAVRGVKTKDFITANIAEIPWNRLTETSDRILRECHGVSQVYVDITPKPPATIEFE